MLQHSAKSGVGGWKRLAFLLAILCGSGCDSFWDAFLMGRPTFKYCGGDKAQGAGEHLGTAVAVIESMAIAGAYGTSQNQGTVYIDGQRCGGASGFAVLNTPGSLQPNSYYGTSVAISGNTIAAGAPAVQQDAGVVFVTMDSGANWSSIMPMGGSPKHFGFGLSIAGSTMIVGADGSTLPQVQGSAYIFTWNASTKAWFQQGGALSASDRSINTDKFGTTVAISGDSALVGAPGNGQDALPGAAYMFTRSGNSWSPFTKLSSNDPNAAAAHFQFGYAVSLDADYAAVGAVGDQGRAGAVYIFKQSGSDWALQARLTASDGQPEDLLGTSVSISGNTLIAGAPGKAMKGAAYLFIRSSNGTWTQQSELVAGDGGMPQDRFGCSVAVSGDRAVVGAPGRKQSSGAYFEYFRM